MCRDETQILNSWIYEIKITSFLLTGIHYVYFPSVISQCRWMIFLICFFLLLLCQIFRSVAVSKMYSYFVYFKMRCCSRNESNQIFFSLCSLVLIFQCRSQNKYQWSTHDVTAQQRINKIYKRKQNSINYINYLWIDKMYSVIFFYSVFFQLILLFCWMHRKKNAESSQPTRNKANKELTFNRHNNMCMFKWLEKMNGISINATTNWDENGRCDSFWRKQNKIIKSTLKCKSNMDYE